MPRPIPIGIYGARHSQGEQHKKVHGGRHHNDEHPRRRRRIRTRSSHDIAADPAAAAAFKATAEGHRLPDWVHGKTVESPGQEVRFGGDKVYVMSACKQHDCGSEQIAVLYDPEKRIMYGVLLVANPETRAEKLTWMNLGPSNEAIDGRTILHAALIGSLGNHPDAFDYK